MDGQDERGGGAGLATSSIIRHRERSPISSPPYSLGKSAAKRPFSLSGFRHVRGEFPFFVPFRRPGGDLFLGQAADHILQHELFFGQAILQGLSSFPDLDLKPYARGGQWKY